MKKEITREEEQELIIKNAFDFFKRQDLIIINKSITYPFLSEKRLEEYEVYELSYCEKSFFCKTQKIKIKYKSNMFGLSIAYLSDDQNLIKLFDKTYNRLKAKLEQQGQIMKNIKILRIDDEFIKKAQNIVNNKNIIITIHSLDKSKTGIIYYEEDGYSYDYSNYSFDGIFLGIVNDEPFDYMEIIISDDIQFTREFSLYKGFLNYEEITIDDVLQNEYVTIEEWD